MSIKSKANQLKAKPLIRNTEQQIWKELPHRNCITQNTSHMQAACWLQLELFMYGDKWTLESAKLCGAIRFPYWSALNFAFMNAVKNKAKFGQKSWKEKWIV